MTSNGDLCQALAVIGFKGYRKNVEAAGIHYEVCEIRTRLLFGLDCSNVLGSSWGNIARSDSQQGFTISRNSSALDLEAENTSGSNSDDESAFDKEDKSYAKFLKNLDPVEWKHQDHYKVLGLSKLRYKSTTGQVKAAYKKKVLNHHPDKRRQKGELVKNTEEDYFTCISKAYEVLSNLQKRRAYDSVDPLFDETIPSGTLTYKENFFKLYAPAFERNERWSTVQPVPKLGDSNSTSDEVNRFYNFWYNMDSWREFSYLDEEDKEKGENRLEKRWIDKQNKAERDKRRKDELKRLRTLIDSAFKNDPRVQKFKEEEKRRKEEERTARDDEKRQRQEAAELERRLEAEREERERLQIEEDLRQKQLLEKKEKDQLKKALQKERKSLKEFCQKFNHFREAGDEKDLLEVTVNLDKLCLTFGVEKLRQMNEDLTKASKNSNCLKRLAAIYDEYTDEMNRTLERERLQATSASTRADAKDEPDDAAEWSTVENQLLIKAMTIFPVGTKSRWDVIAAFINEHLKSEGAGGVGEQRRRKTGKDVVAKVKQIQKLDEKSKEDVSKGMPLLQTRANATVETAPSVRTDSPADAGWEGQPWTAQEQKLLEQALKTFPAEDPDRWASVARCLPGRSKKDCMRRYKELAELIRARKVALQQQQQRAKADASSLAKGK